MIKRVVYGLLAALLLDASFLYALYLWDVANNMELSMHAYYAFGAGIFFTVLVGVALAALSFFSAASGQDDMAHDLRANEKSGIGGGA